MRDIRKELIEMLIAEVKPAVGCTEPVAVALACAKAKELLKESREVINKAHRYQTELIQNEASGNRTEISVILIHAQDHLMNGMNFQQLAEEIVDLHLKLQDK